MASLCLVPFCFGGFEKVSGSLAASLDAVFGLPVTIRPAWFDPEDAFESARGQYNSTLILEMLQKHPHRRASKVLGVTDVDLFIPVLTYVFGEAQLEGRAAVVSGFRLRNEHYGLQPDPEQFLVRLKKEAIHELGHTFGLVHCHDMSCVMRASTYAEELELKSQHLCTRCLKGMKNGRG